MASLYERLGGLEAITSVVDSFVARCADDIRINSKFERTDIPPREPGALEHPDDPAAWVDLETAQTVERGGGKGVVVVVPGLAEGKPRKPPDVTGLVTRRESLPTPVVADRVDRPGHMVQ